MITLNMIPLLRTQPQTSTKCQQCLQRELKRPLLAINKQTLHPLGIERQALISVWFNKHDILHSIVKKMYNDLLMF